MICVNQFLSFMVLFFRSSISGLQLYRTDALLSIQDRFLMIVICGLILWGNIWHINIETFVMAQFVSYAVAAFVSFLSVKPHLQFFKVTFDRKILHHLLKETYPFAVLGFVMSLYSRADMLLLKKLLPDGDLQNGIYASANRLVEAANMLSAMFGIMLLPMFSKMLKSNEDISSLIKLMMIILIIPATVCTFFCSWNSDQVYLLLSRHLYSDYSASVFSIAVLTIIPMCMVYVFGTLLTAARQMKALIITAIVAFLSNFFLNLYLIPLWQAYGAAISALFALSIVGVGNLFSSIKYFKHTFTTGYLLKTALVVSLSLVFVAVMAIFTSQLVISMFFALLFMVFLSAIAGLYPLKAIKQLISSYTNRA
jgi:O-antigen/teichoic acid export membrane protein